MAETHGIPPVERGLIEDKAPKPPGVVSKHTQSTQKAQEIVDAAHDNKYSEALELLRLAHSKAAKLRSEINGPSERHRKEDRHD